MSDIEINDDSHLDDQGQPQTINLEELGETDEENPEEESEDEGKENKGESNEDKDEPEEQEPDWESDQNPYKKRFGDSQREVNDNLLPKIKSIPTLESKITELEEALKSNNPEKYDNLKIQSELAETRQQLAEILEKSALDDFISENPLAKSYRDRLKTLGRAFPTKSLDDLWSENFKDIAEVKAENKDKITDKKKKSQSDKGKGSPTKELSGQTIAGMPVEEFNKLSVAKRRELLDKHNITGV